MRRLPTGALAAAALLLGAAPAAAENAAHDAAIPPSVLEDAEHQWGMLERYCFECHNFLDWAGGIAFDTLAPESVPDDAEVWEEVVRRLRGRLMPPQGHEQPDQERIDGFVGWMESVLDSATSDAPRAGYVPVQRLNRTEYAAAVRGLLGVEINPADYLPTEIEVDGFDNIASALSVSPAFLEQYISAARAVARRAVGDRDARPLSAFYPSPTGAQTTFEDGLPLGTRGGMVVEHHFPADGEYRFSIRDLDAGLYPRGIESEHTLVMLIGGEEVYRGRVGGESDLALIDREGPAGMQAFSDRFADIPVQVRAGDHRVVVTFVERARAEPEELIGGGAFGGMQRLPRVLGGVEIAGPFETSGVSRTASRELLFVCEPQSDAQQHACAERITEHLARRAFRRPVTEDEVARLMQFYEAGLEERGHFDGGIEYMVTAVLASPDFLYRAFVPSDDAAPRASTAAPQAVATQYHVLSDLELASRLSFFLWRQGPDDALIERAAAGELKDPEVLEAEVRRMLADPRASMLVTDFALKWLNLNDLGAVDPDPRLFPGFNARLREDFAAELELFLKSVLLEDRNVMELLTAQHTYLNERLARHYGIDTVHGAQFRRVLLEDEARWGLLGKGAVLLRTSYGDRTSPVLRGAWVLEKIMGTPPAPPPPDAETDLSIPEGEMPTTQREQLRIHREDPSCNSCHGVIDPIGLALEHFDVTGEWRDYDVFADAPIDASTVLPNGNPVNGPADLRRELAARPQMFVQALTERLMMFALGRELEYHDMPQVRAIVRDAAREDHRFSAIVLGVVNSDAFRLQPVPQRPGADNVQATADR